jgi:two-component system, sensor histidine kinase and response regulator
MALEEKGYDVLESANGAQGVELARRHLPDLILCDVNMDQMDGYSTLSSLRNELGTASIPVILMTGLADNAGMRHGMELGADDYLPKPFTLDDLYAAVEARLKKVQTVRQEAEKKLADLRQNISLMLPHELRTPLNGILAYGELLSEEAASLPPAEIAEMGQVIQNSARRLERLVENFLIYAQIELLAADPQKVHALRSCQTQQPAEVIEQRARAQAESAQRGQDLVLRLANIPVSISDDYLGRIVDELVQNAFKFSDLGSPVEVSLSPISGTVVLSVGDRGRGFSTEHITRVGAYMQFDRKMHEQQGLGLGLTIAKRLAELHAGTLTIERRPDSGTIVHIKLPAVKRSVSPPQPSMAENC